MEALSQKERHDEALSLLPKLVEKLVWVPIIFVMLFFHSQLCVLMPYYTKTGRFRPLIA
jgi:hypothetical protein